MSLVAGESSGFRTEGRLLFRDSTAMGFIGLMQTTQLDASLFTEPHRRGSQATKAR